MRRSLTRCSAAWWRRNASLALASTLFRFAAARTYASTTAESPYLPSARAAFLSSSYAALAFSISSRASPRASPVGLYARRAVSLFAQGLRESATKAGQPPARAAPGLRVQGLGDGPGGLARGRRHLRQEFEGPGCLRTGACIRRRMARRSSSSFAATASPGHAPSTPGTGRQESPPAPRGASLFTIAPEHDASTPDESEEGEPGPARRVDAFGTDADPRATP